MESEPAEGAEPHDSYGDCTGESAEEDADVWIDRITGKRRPKPDGDHGGWSELQVVRARVLCQLLARVGVPLIDRGDGLPLMTLELAPFVAVTDELFGERLKELATTLEVENTYGYSYEPEEDETQAGKLRAAEREVRNLHELNRHQYVQITDYLKRIDELAAERDALQRVVDGRAAIELAEPAFAAVERAVEQRG